MTLKEQLTEKKNALVELESQLAAEDVSEETIEAGETLAAEIDTLEKQIARAEKAANILTTLGNTKETNTDETEKKNMNDFETFTKSAKEMTDRKSGVTMHLETKASNSVVTGVTIADVDKTIAPQPKRIAARDFFTNATISGNAITYFLQGAYEGTPAVTSENSKKTQNSTSFTGTTLALSKIAAYIKETDEILEDAAFLTSEVQNALLYHLGIVEDSAVIDAIAGTEGIGAATYDTTSETFADGILKAIKKVKSDSAYNASVVILNPADVYTLQTSKDLNGQYYGGGYFGGAYGNGAVNIPANIWGVQIFESSDVDAGNALVCAREAVKIWSKSGVDVKVYEQNEDDALYNRVVLLGEERMATAVVDLKGVVLLTSDEES